MAVNTKIALVTGGSRGLGKNMAIAIAKKGIDVIITYNSKKDEADEVVKDIQNLGQTAVAIQLNVAESGTFDTFIENVCTVLQNTFKTNKFDFLVNNAGIGIHNSFAETTEDEFDLLTNIHFKGPFFLTQKALPILNDGGGIVNISSGLARFSFPGYAAYASMKGAIETLTKYQAKELGER
jgi:NAD(P)-dependent dehydrogenase (short-subunit alcohol dehydrogenase family)